jgi:hypothetical protein
VTDSTRASDGGGGGARASGGKAMHGVEASSGGGEAASKLVRWRRGGVNHSLRWQECKQRRRLGNRRHEG